MRFKKAVEATPGLSDAYCSGIQALAGDDRRRLICKDTRRLTGSVCLEKSLNIPNSPVWDYGLGWKSNSAAEHAIWIEVHPASSHHVRGIINKVAWLRRWLVECAPALEKITRRENGFVWIASGGVSLPRNSPQARQLALAGVSFPRERFSLV